MDYNTDSGQQIWSELSQDSIPYTFEYNPSLYTQSVQISNINNISPGNSFESAPIPDWEFSFAGHSPAAISLYNNI